MIAEDPYICVLCTLNLININGIFFILSDILLVLKLGHPACYLFALFGQKFRVGARVIALI